MIDLIVVLVVGVILYFGMRYWIRENKKGRCVGCSECGGKHGKAGCSCHTDQERAK